MNDEDYTNDEHSEHDDIVHMNVERRYERLKVILEDPEKSRELYKNTRLSHKKYSNRYKQLQECLYMCHALLCCHRQV